MVCEDCEVTRFWRHSNEEAALRVYAQGHHRVNFQYKVGQIRSEEDTKLLDRMRFLGNVVEWFWYLAFGRPRRGLYSLEPTDVAEVEVWNVRNADSGVERKLAIVSVTPEDARLALRAATLVVEAVGKTELRILEALPAGPPRQGDHDLVVERRGVRGRGSMEVKLMQIG